MSTWLLCRSVTASLLASSFVLFGKFIAMQYSEFFSSAKNDKFPLKIFEISDLMFKTLIVGTD